MNFQHILVTFLQHFLAALPVASVIYVMRQRVYPPVDRRRLQLQVLAAGLVGVLAALLLFLLPR